MSVLEQLPLEISAEILSYLPCVDLAKTSRLSHHMHAVSQPLLYKAPTLTSADGKTKSSLQILLEVLLSPGGKTLAGYVRSLHVQWGSRCESSSDISLLTEAASRLGLQLPLTWEDAQLVLLLHLLPRLHALNLSPPDEGDDRLIRLIHAQTPTLPGTTPPPGLRHLRRFQCSPEKKNEGVSPSILLTLLTMPCMREIDVRVVDEDTIDLHEFEAAASKSAVTHLRLLGSDLYAQSLTCVLNVPAALTHFTFSAHGNFHMARFGEALQPLKHSLQFLHLEFFGRWMYSIRPDDGSIGSLRDWAALRTVQGSLMAFVGRYQSKDTPRLADVLPAGIRDFEILRDHYWSFTEAVGKMRELVVQKSALVPELQRLAADLGGRGGLRSLDSLTGACEEAAVLLMDNRAYRDTLRERAARGGPRVRGSCCRKIRRA